MSIPTSYGDGPHGPEPLITISKRTAVLIVVAAMGLFFALATMVWIIYGVYRTAVHDRDVANATTACARQVNADAVSAIGFTITDLGALDAQLGATIKTLVEPDPASRASAFASEAAKLQPLADDLANQSQVLKQDLNDLQQVNKTCGGD